MSTPLLQGFPPVVDDAARLLILGSFPSVQSLAQQQYYANPRNAFWPMMAGLFGVEQNASYEKRLATLQSHGIALWDVLHSCRRVGSADARIDPKSLVANDFGKLFDDYSGITRVYFNGQTAATLFRRLVHVDRPLTYQLLPSSSPARAMRHDDKLAAWQAITRS
jgi:hypoxanthine-DNA glycosylase